MRPVQTKSDSNKSVQRVLDRIEAEYLKKSPNPKVLDRLNKELDRLIGTEMKDEDLDRAESWERGHRG